MKKKDLALLTAAFLAAITINLQAQDSSDGIVPGPLNPVTHEYCWSIGGNFLSITTGSKLGSTNAILLMKVEELTLYVIELQKQVDEMKQLKEERK